MQKITYKDIEHNIPTSWNEMTILQLYSLNDYIATLADTDTDDNVIYSNIFHHMTGLSKGAFLKLSVTDAIAFKQAMSFITETKIKEEQFKNKIEYKQYVLKVKNFDKLNFGEFIDATAISSETSSVKLIKLLSLVTDVYIKKDIKKFRFKDKLVDATAEQKEDIISNLPATQANAIVAFFLHGQKQLGRNTVSYLNKLALRLAMKAVLLGAGLTIFGLWMHAKMILRNLMKWLFFRSDKSLPTLPTEHQKIT
jgi:hypothetical protein